MMVLPPNWPSFQATVCALIAERRGNAVVPREADRDFVLYPGPDGVAAEVLIGQGNYPENAR